MLGLPSGRQRGGWRAATSLGYVVTGLAHGVLANRSEREGPKPDMWTGPKNLERNEAAGRLIPSGPAGTRSARARPNIELHRRARAGSRPVDPRQEDDGAPPRTDAVAAGSSSASVTDANVVVEGAAPGNGSWLVSGRRTYYDLVAGIVTDQNLPSFADLQLQAGWVFGPGHRLSVLGLTSRENADFRFDDETDPAGDSGGLISESGNDLGSVRFDAGAGERGDQPHHRLVVPQRGGARRRRHVHVRGAPVERPRRPVRGRPYERGLRPLAVGARRVGPAGTAHGAVARPHAGRRNRAAPPEVGRRPVDHGGPERVGGEPVERPRRRGRGAARRARLGAARDARRGVDPGSLPDIAAPARGAGLRLEWSTVNGDVVLSPRLAATVALGWESRLRLAGGLYAQSPGYEKLIQSDYFFDLSPGRIEAPAARACEPRRRRLREGHRRGNPGAHRGLLQDL